jgi:hypothetical protein
MKSIKETILEKIKEDKLSQKPRLYFTLKVVLLVLVSLAILVISIFILNFILFSIRINSQDELLGFGPRGVMAFLRFFPWAWFILDLIFIAFLQKLIRKFKFGYRVPVLYLLVGIFGATVVLGFVVDRTTDVNDRMLRRADGHRMPSSFDRFYRGARHPVAPGNGVCVCTIVDLFENKMLVADNRFGTTTLLSVTLPMHDSHATSTNLRKGDTVFIAGELKDGMIQAFGVKKLKR